MLVNASLSLKFCSYYPAWDGYGVDSLKLIVKLSVPGKLFRIKLTKTLCYDKSSFRRNEFYSNCETYLSDDNLLKEAAEEMIMEQLKYMFAPENKGVDSRLGSEDRIKMQIKRFNKRELKLEVEFNQRE
ncbi:hypothetical protein D3C71_1160930 [compost metagenome]